MTAFTRSRPQLRAAKLAAMREALMREIEDRVLAIEEVTAWPLPDQEPP